MRVMVFDTYPDEEVYHEENVKCKIDLLCGIHAPWDALFHAVRGGVDEVDHQRGDRQDEHQTHLE